jgi:hypothetical protein
MRDLSLERIRELALEADEVEMTLVALLFRTVASVRDRRK